MATWLAALGACAARMTSAGQRLAERLKQKLEDGCLLWRDVRTGLNQARHGSLIREMKDWRLDAIRRATRLRFEIVLNGQLKVVRPLQQAKRYAVQAVNTQGSGERLSQHSTDIVARSSHGWLNAQACTCRAPRRWPSLLLPNCGHEGSHSGVGYLPRLSGRAAKVTNYWPTNTLKVSPGETWLCCLCYGEMEECVAPLDASDGRSACITGLAIAWLKRTLQLRGKMRVRS